MFLDDTYEIIREIGQGGTGTVHLAYHRRLQKYVVIKRIHLPNMPLGSLRKEADILKQLHHRYLPQVYDFLQSGQDVYTVIDYIPGQNLEEIMAGGQPVPEKTLVRWLRQLLEVLDYLHNQQPPIIHSDIKPGNIILTPTGDICLIDFNVSLVGVHPGAIAGFTNFYAAPEQVRLANTWQNGQPAHIALDARTDLYSLAATFYALIAGVAPMNPPYPLQKIAAGRYSKEFLAILDKALSRDPAGRYRSAKKMQAALERLRRNDKRYRTYVKLQALSWMASALLLASGIFCILRGVRTQDLDRYQLLYRQLSLSVQNGNEELILQQSERLLQKQPYRRILLNSPQDYGAVLHALGDCYYNREDYVQAAGYYTQTLEVTLAEDPARGQYFEDAAIALAMAGQTDRAVELLRQAERDGIDTARQELVRAVLAQREGDAETCLEAVQKALVSPDAELCARVCLVAAQVQPDLQMQIEWLLRADAYQRSRDTLRRLGHAYTELAAQQRTQNQMRADYATAVQYFELLCDMPYPALNDSINLAVAQLSAGQAQACVQTLQALEQDNPDDYRIEMNLAFAYDELGDKDRAASYGSQALRHWREDQAVDREPESSDAIQNLLGLQQELQF